MLVAAANKTRTYDAPARRAAAASTRARVLDAAHSLFTGRGYAQTSVTEIAQLAQVSLDTVYAAVGRKPQLLLAVHDMVLAGGQDGVSSDERAYVRAIRAAPTARAKIETYAAALGRVLPITAPLMIALRDAGFTDPACRAMWEHINERRAANMLRFATELRATGEIRDDLTDQHVADLVWSTSSAEYFQLLTSRGHSPSSFASLIVDLWNRALLGP